MSQVKYRQDSCNEVHDIHVVANKISVYITLSSKQLNKNDALHTFSSVCILYQIVVF